ncbi:sigma-70 family RNA polymerase sigma factor [Dactylosporangium roseum]|uniref:Sigma-70 family RNA polymerase sigma factor n=1 Tax=Dactylosporangium roseum TaxID=47989 RepID=A0ABY5ZGR4_9ACTN|nr:sigma-70 family RNA polymerase sigma factor [Dactylosporangium roseum]UWZ39942.1 sigma-70 family RNA polymerase sigma factor [Dactylosporangium roseum]
MDGDSRRGPAWHDALYRRFQPVVHRFLFREVAFSDVEDLVQKTFETAWAKRDTVPDKPIGWLLKTAHNHAREHHRWLSRHPAPVDTTQDDWVCGAAGDDDGASTCTRLDLHRAWSRLSRDDQRILLLADVDGRTGEEIGEVLGISAATARKRLERARERARALLRDGDGDTPPGAGLSETIGRGGQSGSARRRR